MTLAGKVVFHVAAGPRIGFGHLVRCRSLARALGVAPVVAIRGTAQTRRRAAVAGWTVVRSRQLWAMKPDAIVIDDPSPVHSRAIERLARRRGAIAVSIAALCMSTTHAVLDPSIVRVRRKAAGSRPRVLIALGGGAHVFALAGRISREIAGRVPGADLVAAAGFSKRARKPALTCGRWITAPDGLAKELSRATVAVVAGGVTAYEACAIGVPSVAIAVVPAQRPAIRRLARRRALVDAKHIDAVAGRVARLLSNPQARGLLSSAARKTVDGRGARRVADHIRRLVDAA